GITRTWRTIGRGTLSRIDYKNFKREQVAISFPESRHLQYRIVIENRDSAPLEIAGVVGEGNVYEVVFFATPGKHYRLAYGAQDAQEPRYDTAAILTLLEEGFQPTSAELEPEVAYAGAGRRKTYDWSNVVNDPRLLVAVIALLVIALSWGLYQAVKRVDRLQTEPRDDPPSRPDEPRSGPS
ncbi:MAG: hypothetical protein ACOC46_02950, partial [Pirellulales bacterium]